MPHSRTPLRVIRLLIGLVLYGIADALMIRAAIGVDPWTVFAQGVSHATGWGIGLLTNVIGLLVLLAWIPLRQRPGLGTVLNVLLVGTSIELGLWFLPVPTGLPLQIAFFTGGILLLAVASGIYIGSRFGPGPRDGLMTGIHARYSWPIWLARTTVEATVLLAGWLLGGNVGVGTVVFALLIGPLCGITLPLFAGGRRGSLGRMRRGVVESLQPFALAAAFASRLVSRTRVSDSASTMSATERYEPSSP